MCNKEIPVFFSVDDNYAPLLSVALNSAIRNSSPENSYRAIVIYKDLTEENKKRLKALETDNFKISFYFMQDELDEITDKMENRLRCDFFTLTIYFRLFIPQMFPQYDKGIYVDCDIALNADIAEMFNIDIGDNYLGGCLDTSVHHIEPIIRYYENAVGVEKERYINSGVLQMNLKALREANFHERFLELFTTYHFDTLAPDQDYINVLCYGKIKYLSNQWNAMPNETTPKLQDVKLIHYNFFCKPWGYDGIQYEEYFWKYTEGCGYEDEIKAIREAYDDEHRRADKECQDLLVSRCDVIVEDEMNFKKVRESGVNLRL